jgi:hypothetical protein
VVLQPGAPYSGDNLTSVPDPYIFLRIRILLSSSRSQYKIRIFLFLLVTYTGRYIYKIHLLYVSLRHFSKFIDNKLLRSQKILEIKIFLYFYFYFFADLDPGGPKIYSYNATGYETLTQVVKVVTFTLVFSWSHTVHCELYF